MESTRGVRHGTGALQDTEPSGDALPESRTGEPGDSIGAASLIDGLERLATWGLDSAPGALGHGDAPATGGPPHDGLRLSDLASAATPGTGAPRGLTSNDPLVLRYAMQTALAAALPPGTPANVAAELKQELDSILRDAADAKPITLNNGQTLTPNEAIRGLAAVLGLAAQAQQASRTSASSAPTSSAPTAAASTSAPPHEVSGSYISAPPERPATPPVSNTKQAADAFTPTGAEAKKLRERIDDAMIHGKDTGWEAISHEPKMLALMTPAEKAQAIHQLMKGHTTDKEDRAILNILESCKSRGDFDETMRLSGEGAVYKELDNGDAKQKTAMLFQMWGRTDLVPNNMKAFVSRVPEGILLEDDGHGLDGMGSDPAAVDGAYGQHGGGMDGTEARSFDKHLYSEMDPGGRAELIMENSSRKLSGKPPLDLNQMQSELRAIQNDKSLTDDQRSKKTEEVRKTYGLSGDTMRDLGTSRMARAAADVQTDLTNDYQAIVADLDSKRAVLVANFGEGSAEVEELDRQRQIVAKDADERLGRLQHEHDTLAAMYQPPPSFWEKVGSFLEKVGKFALKALDALAPLLNFIPGVGQMAFLAYEGVKTVIAAANGDVLGALASLASAAVPLGGQIGGSVGALIKQGGTLLKDGLAVVNGAKSIAHGDVVGGLMGMAGGLTAGGKSLGIMSDGLADTITSAARIGGGLYQTAEGVATGHWERALGGLSAAADALPGEAKQRINAFIGEHPVLENVFDHAKQGAKFFNDIRTGHVGAGLETLDRELTSLTGGQSGGFSVEGFLEQAKSKLDAPWAQSLFKGFEESAPFVEAVVTGRHGAALEKLLDFPELGALRGPVEAAHQAVKSFEPTFQAIAGKVLEDLELFEGKFEGNRAPAARTPASEAPAGLRGFFDPRFATVIG